MQASAPGKVLILGGYLIVQAPNVGISIGVNARFTTRLSTCSEAASLPITTVRVASPQFNTHFTFECDSDVEGNVSIRQTEGPASPFIQYGILYSVAAARLWSSKSHHNVSLELLADNDFYSQRNYLESRQQSVNVTALRTLPPHLPLVGDVSKTGLGSSAAMTTSLVACLTAALCGHGGIDTELFHRVAQVAHSVAQGKIGSGFDVYTAVYGTCAYRRFPASKVECVMQGAAGLLKADVRLLAECIDPSLEWVAHEPFRLPAGLKLVLGDVHQGGSSTPGMVAKIMAWQKALPADDGSGSNLWLRLKDSNERYVECLRTLLRQAAEMPTEHEAAVRVLAAASNIGGEDSSAITTTAESQANIIAAARFAARSRKLLREMGISAGVEVEPAALTALLDSTAAIPGVFAVGCPGAGGYDAVFALVLTEERCEAVERFWESYPSMNVCPLLVREDAGGLLVEGGDAQQCPSPSP